jgi:hypothetical protein
MTGQNPYQMVEVVFLIEPMGPIQHDVVPQFLQLVHKAVGKCPWILQCATIETEQWNEYLRKLGG